MGPFLFLLVPLWHPRPHPPSAPSLSPCVESGDPFDLSSFCHLVFNNDLVLLVTWAPPVCNSTLDTLKTVHTLTHHLPTVCTSMHMQLLCTIVALRTFIGSRISIDNQKKHDANWKYPYIILYQKWIPKKKLATKEKDTLNFILIWFKFKLSNSKLKDYIACFPRKYYRRNYEVEDSLRVRSLSIGNEYQLTARSILNNQ